MKVGITRKKEAHETREGTGRNREGRSLKRRKGCTKNKKRGGQQGEAKRRATDRRKKAYQTV